MKIVEVINKQDRKDFLRVAKCIYKNDPHWICPLETVIEETFDPGKNLFYQYGSACRWVLKSDSNQLLGRIAAFYDQRKFQPDKLHVGGMGFFECVDDQAAADLLFRTAKDWLEAHGAEAMDGPVNFGQNDMFWGLLVKGFNPPSFGMSYNPEYYKRLFEGFGFTFYYEQVSNILDLTKKLPERLRKLAHYVLDKGKYTYKHFDYRHINKYLNDFVEIHNDAWQFHENFEKLEFKELKSRLLSIKAFVIKEFIWFAYYKKEPVGVIIMLPDINQILKFFGEKISFWDRIRIYRLKRKKIINRARVLVMGVKTMYQRTGVESGFFWHMEAVMEQHPEYKEMELSWVGSFNPKMQALLKALGSKTVKRYITYRYMFDARKKTMPLSEIPLNTKERKAVH